MALVRLMYWKEIPVTVQASDKGETISHPLDARFQEAAAAIAQRFNDGFPDDFVARIRDLANVGERDTSPGAIDNWIKG